MDEKYVSAQSSRAVFTFSCLVAHTFESKVPVKIPKEKHRLLCSKSRNFASPYVSNTFSKKNFRYAHSSVQGITNNCNSEDLPSGNVSAKKGNKMDAYFTPVFTLPSIGSGSGVQRQTVGQSPLTAAFLPKFRVVIERMNMHGRQWCAV